VSGAGAYIASVLYLLPGLLIGTVLHELAHAAFAARFGDPAPRRRLSLDPRRHLDPLGTATLLIAGFGWNRPVTIDPLFLRRTGPRAATTLAGPLANLIVAAVFAVALRVEVLTSGIDVGGLLVLSQHSLQGIVTGVLMQGFLVNLALLVFNLVPLPGLDGYVLARCLWFHSSPRLFLWLEAQRGLVYGLAVVVVVALPELTGGAVNPLAAATVGLAGAAYAHMVEPGVTPLFLALPNVFTLFA
jgi:Zn-dependent protease